MQYYQGATNLQKILINDINGTSLLNLPPKKDLNNKVAICKFEAIYNDLEDEEKFKRWTCKEKINNSKVFCAFHDKIKLEWDDNTSAKFRAKIQEAIEKETTLECIGYHFPMNISFKFLHPKYHDNPLDHDTRERIYAMPIYLCDADFEGQVDFSHCTFENTLNLSGAIFRKQVFFRGTSFKRFYPRGTNFCGNVSFRWAKFEGADFHDTLFKDKANFRQSVFRKKTRFRNARFQGKVNFIHSRFLGETEFLGTTFNEAFFSQDVVFKGKTKFKYAVFENGEKIDFDTKDLSNISFMNTDVTRVKFSDIASWGESNNDKFKLMDERELEDFFKFKKFWFAWPGIDNHDFVMQLDKLLGSKLVDDRNLDFKKNMNDTIDIYSKGMSLDPHPLHIKLEKDPLKVKLYYKKTVLELLVKEHKNVVYVSAYQLPSLESIKAEYRNLRENYEFRLRYDEAGEFFIREMELKRKYHQDFHGNIIKTGAFKSRFSLTGFYHLASYGEKIRMPFLLMAATIFLSLFASLYYFHPTYYPSFGVDGLAPLGNATERSFTTFFQLRNENFIWLDYISKILGILSLGLLAIPLRRKFERKFRH